MWENSNSKRSNKQSMSDESNEAVKLLERFDSSSSSSSSGSEDDKDHNGTTMSMMTTQSVPECEPPRLLVWTLGVGIDLESIIRPHFDYLCQSTNNITQLTSILYSKEILILAEVEQIKRESIHYQGVHSMYCTLIKRATISQLVEAWEKSGNRHIVDYLNNHWKSKNPPIKSNKIDFGLPDFNSNWSKSGELVNPNNFAVSKSAIQCKPIIRRGKCRTSKTIWILSNIVGVLTVSTVVLAALLISQTQPFSNHGDDPAVTINKSHNHTIFQDTGLTPQIEKKKETTKFQSIFDFTIEMPFHLLPPKPSYRVIEIHLTINSEQEGDEQWLDFNPNDESADQVTVVTFMGHFSQQERLHFTKIFRMANQFTYMPNK